MTGGLTTTEGALKREEATISRQRCPWALHPDPRLPSSGFELQQVWQTGAT